VLVSNIVKQTSQGERMTDQNDFNRQLIEEFRANPSKFEGPGSRPLLLLTTTGARSGKRYTTPLMYLPDSDRLIIIASNAGAPKHPDWYYNLLAHPEVTVEFGTKTYDTTANVIQGAERQQLWARLCEQYPFFIDHQAKITRQIPLIALSRPKS
jgi:deazaflavin-dependent oxidoreductase (nitroreductase family)